MPRSTSANTSLSLPGLEDSAVSPVHRQYLDLKRQAGEAILFFRLGDFYETFGEDAQAAASLLDLALTAREMGRGERMPMAGIPAQAVDGYVARLIAAGKHVAIAEQVGVPGRSGIVQREIIRVVTPGTVMESDLLAGSRNNFIAAVLREKTTYGLAYLDVTTGEFSAAEVDGPNAATTLAGELTRIGPSECLAEEGEEWVHDALPPGTSTTELGPELFASQTTTRALTRRYGGTSDATGLADSPLALRAAGALLLYVQQARPTAVGTLQYPRLYEVGGAMVLDRATRRNLDLVESDSGSSGATLLSVLDQTATAMGSRLLRSVLGQPLLDPERINARLDGVGRLAEDEGLRSRLSLAMRGFPDLERLAVRAGQQLLAPRECLALAAGLEKLPGVRSALDRAAELPPILARGLPHLEGAPRAVELIRTTIREDATAFEEGVIKAGVSPELDAQRSLGGDARQWIASLELRERERAGVKSARVGYNRVFGYYFEVSTAQCAQPTDYYQKQASGAATVGEHLEKLGWQRKQTLANAERFITPELKDVEARVARSGEEALKLEREIFNDLLIELAGYAQRIAAAARALAQMDVLFALAEAASLYHYVRPTVDESDELHIVGGRHPVVEQTLAAGRFVPNDVNLGPDVRLMLLTGPNMAGKSTYLRQVAILALMAQVGSFVPADSAHIGVLDRVLTRIGAHDDIAAGRSTFMVEMTEAATILRSATARGLVVLDEIGRGTSTYDGMAMAQAILEDLHNQDRPGGAPKTIFATHYHELTALADSLPLLRNYRVDVLEKGDDVVFLHTVVEGGADRSYGVHVARLAGVPAHVTRRATELLRHLETTSARPNGAVEAASCDVCDQLKSLDLAALSPLQAHAELARLQTLLGHAP